MTVCHPMLFALRFLLLVTLCAIPVAIATAQSATSTLSGTVRDPNNAAIVGARVTATNNGTGLKREATTNDSGTFTIPLLPPSAYTVLVENQGFTPAEIKEVVLNVGDNVALNIQLKVGQVGETVDVKSEAALISESPTVSTVVDRNFAANLPLNGRSFQTLFLLTPGAVVVPTAYSAQGQFSVNGQRADANYFTVDGVSANSGVAGGFGLVQSAGGSMPGTTALGGTQSLVSVDAMQEFRIETSSFAPEFGRTPGAQVSIATRSGTNQWHGSAFEYFRNDVLDANSFFGNANRLPRPRQRQNDFGGVIGGPIIKERTFFFFSYEALRLVRPLTSTTLVPSNAARALLPASVKPLLDLFAVSNNPDLGNGTAQFTASYSDPANIDATSLRVDHTFNPRMTLFGRYSDTPSDSLQRNPNGSTTVVQPLKFRLRSVTLGASQIISPILNNEIRGSYSHSRAGSVNLLDSFGGSTPPAIGSLFQSLNYPSGANENNSLFLLSVAGAGAVLAGMNSTNIQRQFNIVDSLSMVKGDHQLKFGLDYRRINSTSIPRNYIQTIIFSGVLGGNGTLQSGRAQLVSVAAPATVGVLVNNFSLFGQDTWKASPKLTLTYGLRWDVNPAFKSADPNNPFLTVINADIPANTALAPAGTPEYATTWRNIAPRIGIAYRLRSNPGRETVIRGGFGLFYDVGSTYFAGAASIGWPFNPTRSVVNVAVPLTPAQAVAPIATTNPPVNSTIYVSIPDLKLPKTWQFNLAAEQSLGSKQSLTLTYVGAIGRDMIYGFNYSNANATFPSFIQMFTNRGTSDYHAFQAKFQRRLSRGLQVLGSYTWAHSLDTGSDSTTGNPPTIVQNVNTDRGNSAFDIRHSFSTAVVYEVPGPKTGWARAVFGGWSLSEFIIARTAPPVNLTTASVTVNGVNYNPRPNIVAGQPFYLTGSQYRGGKVFNRAAFAAPAAGTQGSLSRNALRGFGAWQMDFSVQRQFKLREWLNMQFRSEFFNVLNHTNFGQPTGAITSALFGVPTATLASSLGSGGLTGGFSPIYQIGGPRSIQFALKFTF